MTECQAVRDQLFEAAPDELAGVARTEVAEHLRDCPRCGPVARVLLDEHARLGRALALVEPSMSADAAVDRVLTMENDESARDRWGERARRFRGFLGAAFPMAAAAAIAAYFVYGFEAPHPAADAPATKVVVSPTAPPSPSPTGGVRVTVPSGSTTIVLSTGNPDITLVWISDKDVPL